MTTLAIRSRQINSIWLRMPSWLILTIGLGFGLLVSTVMLRLLMAPSVAEMVELATELTLFSVLAIGAGFAIFRLGWRHSPSLVLTLLFTFVWAAGATLFLVWIMATRMFADGHDLVMTGIFLSFATIIAIFFGLSTTARVTSGLGALAFTAQKVAEGDLTVRIPIQGRDEVARLTAAFNQMAEQLEAAADQQAELDKLRNDLIAWTSHDLRTPLTSIRAMIEALHDGLVEDDETRMRYYRTMRQDIIDLNTLIDDLFELAQLDAGGLVLEKSAHSLGDLVSDTLNRFRALAAQRGIELLGEIAQDVDPVQFNAPKVGRVLANLVINALNYTPAGGQVQVCVRRVPAGAEIVVRDNGSGFAPGDLTRVFERFYRGEQARSRDKGSAGLGLAIAQGIVEAHGGHIWAANNPDGGALVGFVLPD